MKAEQLIAELQTLPKNATVVMSSDPEGNRISGIWQVQTDNYVAETPWSGYILADEDVADHADEVETVVSIWPAR